MSKKADLSLFEVTWREPFLAEIHHSKIYAESLYSAEYRFKQEIDNNAIVSGVRLVP